MASLKFCPQSLGKLSEVDKCNTKLLGKIIFKGLRACLQTE
ncbi:hypothetical protein [Wolbachia endosymbiont (group A) of Anoplius nigerrimus]|nr:hypothetical protein [Wolbachia endosymbiont (group A) of Anoplius nigerrimus]